MVNISLGVYMAAFLVIRLVNQLRLDCALALFPPPTDEEAEEAVAAEEAEEAVAADGNGGKLMVDNSCPELVMIRIDADVTCLLKDVAEVRGTVTVAIGPPLGQDAIMVLVVERMYCAYSVLLRLL